MLRTRTPNRIPLLGASTFSGILASLAEQVRAGTARLLPEPVTMKGGTLIAYWHPDTGELSLITKRNGKTFVHLKKKVLMPRRYSEPDIQAIRKWAKKLNHFPRATVEWETAPKGTVR